MYNNTYLLLSLKIYEFNIMIFRNTGVLFIYIIYNVGYLNEMRILNFSKYNVVWFQIWMKSSEIFQYPSVS